MFYVYFARGYANEEQVAECRTREAAVLRADEEFANGARDITVVTETGRFVYEPAMDDEGILVEEY
jgi:hypothetical protein